MNSRIINIYRVLNELKLDGLIVSYPANISYLTKYNSRDSYFLVSKKENIYFTDSRYTEEAKDFIKNEATITKINGSVFQCIAKACLSLNLKRIAFEERHLPYGEYKNVLHWLKGSAKLIPTHSLIEGLRQLKEPEEIDKIRKALKITALALEFIEDFISPGKKEIEIVAELERFIRYKGASNNAFDIIVASGPNSSFPHHESGQRRIRENEPVVLDMGIDYQGYKSDLTRVFFLGKINVLVRRVQAIVREAQRRAIEKIAPGVNIAAVDAAGRQYIAQEGYIEFFGHAIGHGVGLEVHEEPHISGKADGVLRSGMVFTVEPAIYLPKQFGIRIEDMVLVNEGDCEVLSGAVHK